MINDIKTVLTEDQIREMAWDAETMSIGEGVIVFARAIEAAVLSDQVKENAVPLPNDADKVKVSAVQPVAVTLETAPIGTRAPSINGGHWYRTQFGWQWNGPFGSGGTFPRPGGWNGDWNGELILPADADAVDAKIAMLTNAIEITLRENAHLADGEDCTLIHLKRAIAAQSVDAKEKK